MNFLRNEKNYNADDENKVRKVNTLELVTLYIRLHLEVKVERKNGEKKNKRRQQQKKEVKCLKRNK